MNRLTESFEADLRDYLREGMHVGSPINRTHLRAVLAEIDGLRTERDAALAEVARLRAALEDLKAQIEWSQSNEARLHFTVNRPMAEIAQYYATICATLAAAAGDGPAEDGATGGRDD